MFNRFICTGHESVTDYVQVCWPGRVIHTQNITFTKDPGQKPFTYQAGVGKVITGWDQGCLGMQVGEERELTIPAKEGYGNGGFPAWGIPPGGTLNFTLECLKIE